MRRTLLAGAAAVIGIAMLLVAALVPLRSDPSDAAEPALSAPDAASLLPQLNQDIDANLEAIQARIDSLPEDAKLQAQLGLTYLQKARGEADPSVLPLAESALKTSLSLQRNDNLPALVGLASLANFRHDFSASVKWSRRAIAANPYNESAYGLLGDALFELGHVRAATAEYQKMVETRPNVASYVRASYTFQYQGRTRGAVQAMKLALQAAGASGESAAYVRHQLGDIYHAAGDFRESARQNRIGVALAPGFVPPTVGVAESLISRGRLHAALPIVEHAAKEMPSLEYAIKLGDLYEAAGRHTDADEAYREVAEKLADYRAAAVLPDADFIVFYADHGLRPRAALREARGIYANRPTGKIADSLAWILESRGHHRAAWRYAQEAVAAPVASPLELFHAGMIAHSMGFEAKAASLLRTTLAKDPYFSVVQAPIARRTLKELTR